MDTEWHNEWVNLAQLDQVPADNWVHVITTLGPYLLRMVDGSPVAVPSQCPDCSQSMIHASIGTSRIDCNCGRSFRWNDANENTTTPESLPIMEVNGTLYAWMPES